MVRCEHGADTLCKCGQCYCSGCFPGWPCPDCKKGQRRCEMVTEFRGRAKWREFLEVMRVADDQGGTISPGGASQMLGITRQRVHEVVNERPDVRAWAYYSERDRTARNFEISVPDLLKWAVRVGRIRSEEDLGLDWPGLKLQVRQILANTAG